MTAALASHIGHASTSSANMPKLSSSRRGMDPVQSKRLVLFCNGDKFFKGKKVFIVPSRYQRFSDFLNDLTSKLPSVASLPYGVRQLFSPTSGRKIRDIDELGDGKGYVCAGFEQFRPLNYGEVLPSEQQRLSRAQVAPRPSATVRPRHHVRASHEEVKVAHVVKEPAAASLSRDIKSPRDGKSKLFVVISNAVRPRKVIRIFLSPHTFPTMDRLLNELQHQFAIASAGDDASLAAAAGEFTSGRIRRLYSIFGVEITSPTDFFKVADHYIALGSEKFTTADLKEIINDIFPNGTAPKNIFKSWESQRSRKRKPSEPQQTAAITAAPATTNQKPQAAVADSHKPLTETVDLEESSEKVSKLPKTGKSGVENVAHGGAPPPVAATVSVLPAVDSRSRIDGERMKKDSGFVDDVLTKESNSPNHHAANQSLVLTSVEQQSEVHRSPRQAEAPSELPTVFEAKSVESTQHIASQQLEPVVGSASPDVAQQSEDKALRPVQLPGQKGRPSPLVPDEHLPSQAAPGDVVSGNMPKTTREVDPELAHLLDSQQQPVGSVQKYAVLPGIGHVKADDAKEAEDDKTENNSERLPAEQLVLDQPAADERSAAPSEALPPPAPSAASVPAQPTPTAGTPAHPPPNQPDSRRTPATPAQPSTRKAQQANKPSQQGASRPKLEHQPLIIDGRPESRPASRSSSTAPNSAPGRVVNGKLSRQLSKIDHIAARFEYVGSKQLGDGNFAVVKKCRRRKTGTEYAMKIIDKSKLKGKFHMVENEIRIMRACDHQNLVKLFEMYETDKEIFLVMELVPDGDLFDAITAAVKFDEPTASKMVHDMASGLFYLHSRRIVHRDLKPENLLVLRQPKTGKITLKLGDFGLAMEVAEPIYSVCGTPTYVAPEILIEKGYGLEVDLWALGVISYILLCGFPPFRSQKRRQSELFEQIKSGRFVFLSPYWDSISVLAKELISKLLVVDARRRYSSLDVLCHPWVISQGGSSHPHGDMAAYRKTLRKSLDDQSRANWKQWVSVRQKNGFTGVLASNGHGHRPGSRA